MPQCGVLGLGNLKQSLLHSRRGCCRSAQAAQRPSRPLPERGNRSREPVVGSAPDGA